MAGDKFLESSALAWGIGESGNGVPVEVNVNGRWYGESARNVEGDNGGVPSELLEPERLVFTRGKFGEGSALAWGMEKVIATCAEGPTESPKTACGDWLRSRLKSPVGV
jgi:hypothetical protein